MNLSNSKSDAYIRQLEAQSASYIRCSTFRWEYISADIVTNLISQGEQKPCGMALDGWKQRGHSHQWLEVSREQYGNKFK